MSVNLGSAASHISLQVDPPMDSESFGKPHAERDFHLQSNISLLLLLIYSGQLKLRSRISL